MDRIQLLLDIAESRRFNFQLVDGYAEPGYPDCPNGLALGNWNDKSYYDKKTNKFVTTDNTPSRIGKLLEKLGVEVDWEDEYLVCDCNNAFRTSGDSYNWTQYGYIGDGWYMCGDCIKKDPCDYLEGLEGKPHKALTFDVDIENHGYVNICVDEEGHRESWENGLYGGQCDTPIKVAESLEMAGIVRYIFNIDSVGQFETRFSVYVHCDELGISPEDDWDTQYAAIEDLRLKIESRGVDPGDLGTGKAGIRIVSLEEFVKGVK